MHLSMLVNFIKAKGWTDSEPLGQYLAENHGVADCPWRVLLSLRRRMDPFLVCHARRTDRRRVQEVDGRVEFTQRVTMKCKETTMPELNERKSCPSTKKDGTKLPHYFMAGQLCQSMVRWQRRKTN